MFNSKRLDGQDRSITALLEVYHRLSERVLGLEEWKKERTGEKIASMFVSPAKAPKKRGRPSFQEYEEIVGRAKRKYIKSGKYAKVTTKKK